MNLLPFLYALLAALTGISAGVGIVGEPRVAESSISASAQAVATAALAGTVAGATASFERLRGEPRATIAAIGTALAVAILPATERPARRRE